MSTRFSPPSRFRSTRAPAPRPLPATLANMRFVRANLLAHDDDLVPLAGRSAVARRLQTLRRLQERVLVAPDEINLQQLQAQIAPIRLALERDAHQVGRLVVQAVGHVEIGFGQRIALIEIDRALARHGVVGGLDVGVRVARATAAASPNSGIRCSPDSSTTNESSPRRIDAELRGRIAEVGDIGGLHPIQQVDCRLCRRRQAAKTSSRMKAMITAAGTHQCAATQSIQDPESGRHGNRFLLHYRRRRSRSGPAV